MMCKISWRKVYLRHAFCRLIISWPPIKSLLEPLAWSLSPLTATLHSTLCTFFNANNWKCQDFESAWKSTSYESHPKSPKVVLSWAISLFHLLLNITYPKNANWGWILNFSKPGVSCHLSPVLWSVLYPSSYPYPCSSPIFSFYLFHLSLSFHLHSARAGIQCKCELVRKSLVSCNLPLICQPCSPFLLPQIICNK